MTILGAATGFEADDSLDLDLRAAVGHPHLVCQRQQLLEAIVGKLQHLQDLLLAQPLTALEHLPARHGENVGAVGAGGGPSRRLSHQMLPAFVLCAERAGRNPAKRLWPPTDDVQVRAGVCAEPNEVRRRRRQIP